MTIVEITLGMLRAARVPVSLPFEDPADSRVDALPIRRVDENDYDVLSDGIVLGRIMKAAAASAGQPWMWMLSFGYHGDRTPTHGYVATREDAMAAFAKNWRRA